MKDEIEQSKKRIKELQDKDTNPLEIFK